MIRCIDFLLATFGIVVTFPILLLLFLIGIFDTGSPLFVQVRVGKHQQPFNLIKFRTMKLNTASVATHLVQASAVTSFGSFLRRTKLDELPQLWNVVKGEMSLVGPRPCLPNQQELIDERQQRGVFQVLPGITGLAQIKGIDMSTPQLLAQTDAQMIQDLTLRIYFQYLFMTVGGAGRGDRIK
jgi:O-antigen biosynthesis protein WbqP